MPINLPPAPPLDPSGFGAQTWQQWFGQLQQVLVQGGVAILGQDANFAKFGANGKTPQAAVTLPANATDLATAIALANAMKATLIANGIAQ